MSGTFGPPLTPVRARRIDSVAIVDGTLIPKRDHRLAAPSGNYWYSANVQIAIGASTRLVVAIGDAHPGKRNYCTVYRDSGVAQELERRPVVADGVYHSNPAALWFLPCRKPHDGSDLSD